MGQRIRHIRLILTAITVFVQNHPAVHTTLLFSFHPQGGTQVLDVPETAAEGVLDEPFPEDAARSDQLVRSGPACL